VQAATDERLTALMSVSSAGPFAHRDHYPDTYHFVVPFARSGATCRLFVAPGRPILKWAGFQAAYSDENVITALQCAARTDFQRHGETITVINNRR
jgi:hypothetical protein